MRIGEKEGLGVNLMEKRMERMKKKYKDIKIKMVKVKRYF